MATKKKRNKKYTGEDAAVVRPTVHKVSVPERSKFEDWWLDHKRKILVRLIQLLFVALLVWGISRLF